MSTNLKERAVSKAQQRLMGMVRRFQKEGGKAPSKKVAKIAKGMKRKEAKKFAKTKHAGLPEKVAEEKGFDEKVSEALEIPKKPEEKREINLEALLKDKLSGDLSKPLSSRLKEAFDLSDEAKRSASEIVFTARSAPDFQESLDRQIESLFGKDPGLAEQVMAIINTKLARAAGTI